MSNYYCNQDYKAQGENQQWYKKTSLIGQKHGSSKGFANVCQNNVDGTSIRKVDDSKEKH